MEILQIFNNNVVLSKNEAGKEIVCMGKGLAIEPTEGKLYAPADGKILTVFPTGHAIGMITNDGTEILMHIGMNTVELDGEGFKILVQPEQIVKQGDLLVEFDIESITKKGYSVVTPIIVTNTNEFLDVLDFNQDEVITNEDCLMIIK
ncbi:MAG TPA: glucose PTS transporter subunit IIA [Enterococcus columbae]|nr:glucose PTS transporter subunit IIA [Enterococcus columbae]